MRLPFCLLILATCERACVFLDTYLILSIIFLKLISYILRNHFAILTYRIYKIPLYQNFVLPYLYFRFACRSKVMKLLFPLRYSLIYATLRYGSILTNMWIGAAPRRSLQLSGYLFPPVFWSKHDVVLVVGCAFDLISIIIFH